jgi:hypothetical protein
MATTTSERRIGTGDGSRTHDVAVDRQHIESSIDLGRQTTIGDQRNKFAAKQPAVDELPGVVQRAFRQIVVVEFIGGAFGLVRHLAVPIRSVRVVVFMSQSSKTRTVFLLLKLSVGEVANRRKTAYHSSSSSSSSSSLSTSSDDSDSASLEFACEITQTQTRLFLSRLRWWRR